MTGFIITYCCPGVCTRNRTVELFGSIPVFVQKAGAKAPCLESSVCLDVIDIYLAGTVCGKHAIVVKHCYISCISLFAVQYAVSYDESVVSKLAVVAGKCCNGIICRTDFIYPFGVIYSIVV